MKISSNKKEYKLIYFLHNPNSLFVSFSQNIITIYSQFLSYLYSDLIIYFCLRGLLYQIVHTLPFCRLVGCRLSSYFEGIIYICFSFGEMS